MKPKKQKSLTAQRNIALCYARQSVTRGEHDKTSIDRQLTAMRECAAKEGWVIEEYVDASGHRSGRSEDNRPQWQALKERLTDPQVVALLAWDSSRLHRHLVHLLTTADYCKKRGIKLILVSPSHGEVDIDRDYFTFIFQGIKDEYESRQTSEKVLHGIAHRKRQGKSWARPPFGTVRKPDGYLMAAPDGVWLMPDGSWIQGTKNEKPHESAIWRGYFDAAQYVMELYTQGYGMDRISRIMHEESYAFCDRDYVPAAFEKDDVRRIVSNWASYGGNTAGGRAHDKNLFHEDVESIALFEDRAVMDVELLRQVARTKKSRSREPRDIGRTQEDFIYPLSEIVYCAHCEAQVAALGDLRLRSRLGGKSQNRYRHRPGVKCACKNKSISRALIETEFANILRNLIIKPEYVDLVQSVMMQNALNEGSHEIDFEEKRAAKIALHQKRIRAARDLFLDGTIERAEYQERVHRNQREIELLKAKTRQVDLDLADLRMVQEMLENLCVLWEKGTTDEQQRYVHLMFDRLVYDLDKQGFTEMKLQAWACKYLQFKVAVDLAQEEGTLMTPTGLDIIRLPLAEIVEWLLVTSGMKAA